MTIREHPGPLPTVPGYAPGITAINGRATTVQCAVCWRTQTAPTPGEAIVGDHGWNFIPDGEQGEPTSYRRCPDCRHHHLHPHPTLWEDQ